MKPFRFLTLIVMGLMLNLAVTGCKHPQNTTNIPGSKRNPMVGDIAAPPLNPLDHPTDTTTTTTMHPLSDTPGHVGWKEDADVFKTQTVHFAFDSSAVTIPDKLKVAAVADYLKSNPAAAVRVEGHCDERGTEEYNRSLGERRSLGVREELIHLGVESLRVDTLSYGEDRPADTGHDDSAWKQNRRGVFILLTP